MKTAKALTAARVRELLDYEPETGFLRWRVGRQGTAGCGSVAGSLNAKGYIRVRIDGRDYNAHRVAWLHAHGVSPNGLIDHKNGDKTDNRLANLREANCAENQHNRWRPQANNRSSGLLGVGWIKSKRRWQARIRVNGTLKHLGYFDDPHVAHDAYLTAKRTLHPFAIVPREAPA